MSDDCRANCPIPNGGYCERHRLTKSDSWVQLCITRVNYWKAWEDNRGPGQNLIPLSPKELLLRRLDYLVKPCGNCNKSGNEQMEQSILQEILEGSGPGSQLWSIFSRLGIEHKPDCPCLLLADIMNQLGSEGCRENRDKIVRILRKNKKRYGWKDYLKAGVNATVLGWTFKVNPLDPLPDLLDMAIKQAEQAEEQQQCQSLGPMV